MPNTNIAIHPSCSRVLAHMPSNMNKPYNPIRWKFISRIGHILISLDNFNPIGYISSLGDVGSEGIMDSSEEVTDERA